MVPVWRLIFWEWFHCGEWHRENFSSPVQTVDNLQNYCLGTRYGARSRSRLCRRLSISLVRYRHGLEKFLAHHFIPIRRRFNPHDLPTDLLGVQDPFFGGRRPIFSTGNDGAWPAMGTPSMAWHVLFLCGCCCCFIRKPNRPILAE